MTSVVVTEQPIYVEVTSNGSSTVVQSTSTSVVTAVTAGPQGATGPQGPPGPQGASGIIVDDAAKVDKSIVYYDASSASWKADAIWTTDTLVDGANF